MTESEMPDESPELRHLLGKAMDAHRGGRDAWRCQSTGEKLAVALVLNKPEWIAETNYTLAEAIDRVGPEWLRLLGVAQRYIATYGGRQS